MTPRVIAAATTMCLAMIVCLAAINPAAGAERELPPGAFANPIGEGADPSVVLDDSRYLLCQSDGDGIAIWVSDRLTDKGIKHVVWRAPETGPVSEQIWAPELVELNDRWYIYFAASEGENRNHRTYVLASTSSDPLGDYTLHGPLYTGEQFETKRNNLWAIDMTVLQHEGSLYAIWSGWTTATSDLQRLYIAPMNSPIEIGGPRTQISRSDDYLWEQVEETKETRGLNEAPQVLKHNDRTFVVYSAAASWLPTYKLGLLELIGENPLNPAAWKKYPEPVFQSTSWTYGVGHGSFVRSPDGTQWWHIYHAKVDREPGWQRVLYVQPMSWTEDGLPEFGTPVREGEPLELPSGEPMDSPEKDETNR